METLYKYQEQPYIKLKKALDKYGIALNVMATGLGKTAVSGHIAKDYLNQGLRGLFLYCENEGLGQSEARFRSIIGPDVSYKRFYGTSTKDWDADQAQMLFASVQSMNSIHGKWYTIFSPDHFDFIIYDEAHHGQADTHKEVLDYFNAKKLGMTGTPDREDDRDIRDIFGKEVVNIPLARGIARGWLKQVEYHTISDGINTRKLKRILREIGSGEKRITVKQLNESIFVQKRDRKQKDIIKSYNTIKEYSIKKRTLIFCENIPHAKSFFRQFKEGEAGLIHSKQNEKINQENLKKFRNGDLQYLLCIDKFNECIHVAGIEVIAFLRATDSKRIFLQQLGRGLAKSGLAEKVIVLDFVQNVQRLIRIRELAKQIREEVEKVDPNKEFDKNVFDVKGKYYDLTHVDTTLNDILNVLEAIEKGFYDTLKEASDASISLNFKSGKDYKARYKEDLRLHSRPFEYYSKEWVSWDHFLGGEPIPDGWMTAKSISSLENVQSISRDIKKKANHYRKNTKWFKIFRSRGKMLEFYHPDLVAILKEQCARKEKAPEGWMTAGQIAKLDNIKGGLTKIASFAEKYRENYPEWFGGYIVGSSNRVCDHYHPDLVAILKEQCARKGKAPEGWMTINALVDLPDMPHSHSKIKIFAEKYRENYPEWFKDYEADNNRTFEYCHPGLIMVLRKEFSFLIEAPEGWMTAGQIAGLEEITGTPSKIEELANTYRKLNEEWFKCIKRGKSSSEFYHPDLVAILKEQCARKEKAPEGWMTAGQIAQLDEIIGDRLKVNSIANLYREKNPQWFDFFIMKNKRSSEHYHPDLVAILKEQCARKIAPKGWMTAGQISKLQNVVGGSKKIILHAEGYKDKKPKWFKKYHSAGFGPLCYHYHPDLVAILKEQFALREKAPERWMTAGQISNLNTVTGTPSKIKRLADTHRKANSKWFKVIKKRKSSSEFYHPDLVAILKEQCARKGKAPEGWMTAWHISKLENIQGKWKKIKLEAQTYNKTNPEWFERYSSRESPQISIYYHPDLVAILKEQFAQKEKAPEGWLTGYKISRLSDVKTNDTGINKFADQFRQKHPHWFVKYSSEKNNVVYEHYHPELVKLIKEKFKRS